jgi:phenylalanyl-tRNA synthetase beta chain
MRLSINWLNKYIEVKESPQELADMLTMLGFEAEIATDLTNLNNVVTASVKSVRKHSNADKLTVCEVFDGKDVYNVVCGAPNVQAEQKIVFAKVGAELPGGFKITKAKIRGEVSFGMICAEDEIGISDNHEGIMVLPNSTKLGLPISEVLNEKYAALELDITPNRPDALSHIGIAREINLKTGREIKIPSFEIETSENITEDIEVVLEDEKGCPRYIAGVVENIKIGPSPKWMQEYLEAAGQRSINNVVDISNYVLLEMGHPTHIFDFSQLPYNKIVVRRAEDGEEFITLDEDKHSLKDYHLLITDGKNPVALAGIMGGLGSAIKDDTNKVLIESAYFDPITIRKGSKSLGMLTESSRRFERGADPEAAITAFYRIVSLLKEYANGKLVSDVVDAYPNKITQPNITLRKIELDLVAGCNISSEIVEEALTGLGILWKSIKNNEWACTPPSNRPDIESEIDLIEEIIRVYGYENIPVQSRYGSLFNYHSPDPNAKINDIVNTFSGLGFRQCYNNSLQSESEAKLSGINQVKTINPLSENLSDLRTSLLPGLLKNIDFNIKNGTKDLQLFELGQVHSDEGKGFEGIVEKAQAAGILYGNYQVPNIHNEEGIKHSFYSLRGNIDNFFKRLNLNNIRYKETDHPEFEYGFEISINKTSIGVCGQIKNSIINDMKLDVENDVYSFILNTEKLLDILKKIVQFKEIAKYPTIERDLNFVIKEEINAGDIVSNIVKMNNKWIKSITPINIFRHDSLDKNNKSIVFKLVFQDDSKTLEDKDVNPIIKEIISIVKVKFNAKLRT